MPAGGLPPGDLPPPGSGVTAGPGRRSGAALQICLAGENAGLCAGAAHRCIRAEGWAAHRLPSRPCPKGEPDGLTVLGSGGWQHRMTRSCACGEQKMTKTTKIPFSQLFQWGTAAWNCVFSVTLILHNKCKKTSSVTETAFSSRFKELFLGAQQLHWTSV